MNHDHINYTPLIRNGKQKKHNNIPEYKHFDWESVKKYVKYDCMFINLKQNIWKNIDFTYIILIPAKKPKVSYILIS